MHHMFSPPVHLSGIYWAPDMGQALCQHWDQLGHSW